MDSKIIRIKSITEGHRLAGLPSPNHPLISLVDYSKVIEPAEEVSAIMEFYSVSIKRGVNKMVYGQQTYDFDEGVMGFISPNQVLRSTQNNLSTDRSGWILFFHPDFLWNTPLAKKIAHYEFFEYSANEALFLSESEEAIINGIAQNIRREYESSIDKFSQDVIIAQMELMFTYAQRFYDRQFITRKISNHKILEKLEDILNAQILDERLSEQGIPSVQFIADSLNLSVKYLGSMLKQHTGQTTQQHIHNKIIEKAKEKLSTTDLTVSEIAYALGFEHSQSFSKFFKSKTNRTPGEFRNSFN